MKGKHSVEVMTEAWQKHYYLTFYILSLLSLYAIILLSPWFMHNYLPTYGWNILHLPLDTKMMCANVLSAHVSKEMNTKCCFFIFRPQAHRRHFGSIQFKRSIVVRKKRMKRKIKVKGWHLLERDKRHIETKWLLRCCDCDMYNVQNSIKETIQ